jgi:hypothetical protein
VENLQNNLQYEVLFLLLLLSLLLFNGAGVEPITLQPYIGLLYQPWMIDGDDCSEIGGMNE